jgi:hypothetical protein
MSRRTCNWCGRGPVQCQEHGCIGPHVKRELAAYISTEGAQWRRKLRTEWMNGSSILRQLRNAGGPRRLSRVNPSAQQRRELENGNA